MEIAQIQVALAIGAGAPFRAHAALPRYRRRSRRKSGALSTASRQPMRRASTRP
jgi:hypothetical protein